MKPLKRLLSYFKNHKAKLVLITLLAFICVSAELAQPFLLGKAIDLLLKQGEFKFFVIYIIVLIVTAILGVLTMYLFDYLVNKLSQEIVFDLRMDVYRKINNVSIDCLSSKQIGNIVQYEIGDIENIQNGISVVFKSLLRGILTVIITIVLMMFVNWVLALIVIILTPLSVLVSRFIAKSNHKYFSRQASKQATLNETSLEAIMGSEVIQSFNSEEKMIEAFETEDEDLRKTGVLAQFAASWINPSTRLVNNTIYAIVGIVGIMMISVSKVASVAEAIIAVMSLGKLSSFLSYTNQYTKPFNEISSVISEYEVAKSSMERINAFLNENDDIDDGKIEVSEVKSITFNHMDFSYNKNKELIKDLNLKIEKGHKIAIVGPTGAGKTTLINVLLRYYDPLNGEVLINDINYKEISKESLRKHFGLVLQDTWIFKGTIFDNIRYGKEDATNEEIIEACKHAHIDEMINTLPFGYETIIKSKDDLSEGEKQMISIARVMLRNPDIVVLDEATSNIDTHTEKLINNAFDELLKDKTSIVIAHRLSTIKNADTILVLKDGSIVEVGNHATLMKKNGLYHSMYSSQFK